MKPTLNGPDQEDRGRGEQQQGESRPRKSLLLAAITPIVVTAKPASRERRRR